MQVHMYYNLCRLIDCVHMFDYSALMFSYYETLIQPFANTVSIASFPVSTDSFFLVKAQKKQQLGVETGHEAAVNY